MFAGQASCLTIWSLKFWIQLGAWSMSLLLGTLVSLQLVDFPFSLLTFVVGRSSYWMWCHRDWRDCCCLVGKHTWAVLDFLGFIITNSFEFSLKLICLFLLLVGIFKVLQDSPVLSWTGKLYRKINFRWMKKTYMIES